MSDIVPDLGAACRRCAVMKRLIALLRRARAGARAGHRARPRKVQDQGLQGDVHARRRRRRLRHGQLRQGPPRRQQAQRQAQRPRPPGRARRRPTRTSCRRAVCKEGAAGGTDVAGFKYKPLKTNRKGVGNSTARSKTFSAKRGVKYSVVVYAPVARSSLCAQLRTKYWHGKPKPKSHEQARQAGKSDDKPGKARATSRGQERRRARPGRGQGSAARARTRPARPRTRSAARATRRRAARPRARTSRSRRRGAARRAQVAAGRRGSPASRAAVSSQRCRAAWPVSVTSPSASIQSRTRSSRTRPSASLGPGPSPLEDSAARAGLDRPAAGVQRRERAALVLGRHVQRVRAGAGRERRPRRVGGARTRSATTAAAARARG